MMKSLETEGARDEPATVVPSKKHPLDDEGVGDYEAEGFVERRLHPLFKRLLVPQAFTAIICVYGVLASGAVNGLFASSGSSVQRSLGLSSMQWGLVATLYEVFLIAFQIFVPYFGGRSHIPRFLGWSQVLLTVGLVVFGTVPHFAFFDPAAAAMTDDLHFCGSDNAEGCPSTGGGGGKGLVLLVFMVAQICLALGSSALWILGPIYLDRNVTQQRMNLYLATVYAAGAIGPAVGFVLNGLFLNRWIDPLQDPPPGLTPKSSMWLGCWWFGYLVFACASLVFLVPLSCFPRYLPFTTQVRRDKLESMELCTNQTPSRETTFKIETRSMRREPSKALMVKRYTTKDVRTFLRACRDILNPMRVFTMLAHGTENFAVSALSTFLPQIIESQFGVSSGATSIVFGVAIVLGATSGIVSGGAFVNWRKYDGVQTARFCMIAALIAIPFSFSFLLMGAGGCGTHEVVGLDLAEARNLDAEIAGGGLNATLTRSCNLGCDCDPSRADLVCINDQTFYNICYAGCEAKADITGLDVVTAGLLDAKNGIDLTENAMDCACAGAGEGEGLSVQPGYCKRPCVKELAIFLCLLFCLMFFTFLNNVPGSQVILRSTELKERPLAMALNSVVYRVTGSLPAPLIFGFLLDKLCLIHSASCVSSQTGMCLLSDNLRVKYLCVIVAVTFKCLSALFLLIAWRLYKRHQDKYREIKDEEEEA